MQVVRDDVVFPDLPESAGLPRPGSSRAGRASRRRPSCRRRTRRRLSRRTACRSVTRAVMLVSAALGDARSRLKRLAAEAVSPQLAQVVADPQEWCVSRKKSGSRRSPDRASDRCRRSRCRHHCTPRMRRRVTDNQRTPCRTARLLNSARDRAHVSTLHRHSKNSRNLRRIGQVISISPQECNVIKHRRCGFHNLPRASRRRRCAKRFPFRRFHARVQR